MKLTDLDNDKKEERQEEKENLLQNPATTKVLLGVIAILLICILVLITVGISNRQNSKDKTDANLQQSIMDYAKRQQEMEEQVLEEDTYKPAEEMPPFEDTPEEQEEEEVEPVSADTGKTAVVVDVEDENDEAYTKEFILKEAYPYFADNRQDAMWDLAHLKRYVKLSKGLEGTGEYYYQGDVDSEGRPHGKGLAIYEKNSYYFGEWSHGVRSGQGGWFRYYINQKNKENAKGIYMSHSYSGSWANDLPNGDGAEHYDVDVSKLLSEDAPLQNRVIQNVVGSFKDGLYNGDMYANTVDYTGNVQEWDGIATEGVFTLWRDMSAIGECAVWRHRDDHSLCLDIDKSENKNQGIRELLALRNKNFSQ